MKRLKSVIFLLLKLAGGFVLISALGLTLVWIWPVERYEPPVRSLTGKPEYKLDEKVGWYDLDDGSQLMVTWGAENGLTINSFDSVQRYMLKPLSEFEFIGARPRDARISVHFNINEHRAIRGFDLWEDGEAVLSATRLKAAGYTQKDVQFFNGETALFGVLLSPVENRMNIGVVFIHGSGVSDRNNFWYLYIANHLALHGIDVLLPDKRGCGRSRGKWHLASFDDFAEDALAGARFLSTSEEIESIGIVGVSQGGWIAPLAGSKSGIVDFIINLSGSATTPNQQIKHEIRADIRNKGLPGVMAIIMEPAFSHRAKARRKLWWNKNGDFDPVPHWRSFNGPVLTVYGRKDEDDNVPIQTSIDILSMVRESNAAFTIQVYDDSGHGLEDPETQWIREELLELMVGFIRQST